MNSNKYLYNIRYVIACDIKRFWILPLIVFIAFFCTSCAEVILIQEGVEYLIADICFMDEPFQLATAGLAPVVTSLVVFHYLHSTNAVIAYHSLPITRFQHFMGHLLAGTLFFTVPAIVNSLILAALSKPVLYEQDGVKQNIFTLTNVFTTLALMLVTMLFVYALCVLAGMLTGTVFMHAIGAMGLNILAPALYWFMKAYFEYFLKGYSVEFHLSTMNVLSPVTGLAGWYATDYLWLRVAVYLVVALLVFALSYRLYKIRKLETATHNLTYPVMVPIVTYIITFFAASFVSTIIAGNHFIPVLACITVVVFILVRMFILKTTRIFNRRTFISLGIYGLVLTLFISSLAFDISGYEKRLPELKNVKSASTNIFGSLGLNEGEAMTFKDKENIKRVYKIHEMLMNAEKDNTTFSLPLFRSDDYYDISVSYDCGGKKINRVYDVDNKVLLLTDKNIKDLYESEECKNTLSPYSLKALRDDKNTDRVTFEISNFITGNVLSVSVTGDKRTLLKAIEKDISARSFEEAMDTGIPSALGNIYIHAGNNDLYLTLYSTDKNTMDWLDSHGHHDEFNINDMVIENLTAEENKEGGRTVDFGKRFAGMTVSDFLDTYGKGDNDYTEAKIILSVTIQSAGASAMSVFDLYYSDDNMPDFLRELEWN